MEDKNIVIVDETTIYEVDGEPMSDKPPITIFDMQTLPLLFQIIKAMIPFLDFPMAKMLSVIIRLNELNYTINYFRSPDCADFISCNSSIPHIHSISDLLENDDFYVPFFLTARLNMPDLSKISSFFPICHQCLTVIQTH